MKRKAVVLMILLLFYAVAGTSIVNLATAQGFKTITINADGSIKPPTAPITRIGNVYTLTGDILGSIMVEKFNSIIDGAGYTLQGNGTWRGIQIANPYNATIKNSYNVIVKNFNVKGFEIGIGVFAYWGNVLSGVVITGNNITNNDVGIRLSSYRTYSDNSIIGNVVTENKVGISIEMSREGGNTSGNTIYGNQIARNEVGMNFLWLPSYSYDGTNLLNMNNTISCNNFVSNQQNVGNTVALFAPACANIWDNSSRGNYWSDYRGKDFDNDGIGDSPYIIDANNKDNYPPMAPFKISSVFMELPEWASSVSVCIINPKNTAYIFSNITLEFTVNKQTTWIGYSLDGQDKITVIGNGTIGGLTNGLHNVTVYAEDTFGNEGASETIIFNIDVREPFPTTLVVAAAVAAAVFGIGLLVYLKKRKH